MKKIINGAGIGLVVGLWIALTLFAWFGPAKAESESERRPLKQWPGISTETLLNGKFMESFEDYSVDQFPLRDTFRQVKSLFHYYGLQQKDNNDIYIQDGYAAKILYPMNENRIALNLKLFNQMHKDYLVRSQCKVYTCVVPDKGYYLAQANGYPSLDYERLNAMVQEQMPWAKNVDITDTLSIQDYYRTDTHWRQECIFPAAQKLAQAMGGQGPVEADFTQQLLERPFYGVYYGHAALPMEPENMYVMNSDVLNQCTVYDYETGQTTSVYNMEKLSAKDPYDVFLSGARALLRIDNPNATSNKRLIVFRDSFGSSISPLLVQDYASVTLVDLRYISSVALKDYIQFQNQDVLFLFNTQVLNATPLK